MSNNLRRQAANLRRDERGQIAIIMVMLVPVLFLIFALALDAGVWFFDHRLAQNQADAAVLAAVQFLPAAETDPEYAKAVAAVDTWLTKNGSDPDELCDPDANGPYPQFSDSIPAGGDGRIDGVRVCVRRKSPGIFSGFADLDFIYVSAVAAARVGPSVLANVKPWAIAPPDPLCGERPPGVRAVLCYSDPNDVNDPYDIDNDGVLGPTPPQNLPEPDGGLEPCGYYPPLPGIGQPVIINGAPGTDPGYGDTLCPWGLHEDKVHSFKVSSMYTPGNFSPIQACGGGGGNAYKECISGEQSSGFYEVGDQVWVDIETGNMVGPTMAGLEGGGGADGLYGYESTVGTKSVYKGPGYIQEDLLECDVQASPHPVTGLDPDGKDRADATYGGPDRETTQWDAASGTFITYQSKAICTYRLVSIVVIDQFPQGGGNALVLGVGTYSIAGWAKSNPNQPQVGYDDRPDPINSPTVFGVGPNPTQSCSQGSEGEWDGQWDGLLTGGFDCGQVWGYFMQDLRPPEVLLQLGETGNPFAPTFIAMVE